MTDKECIDRIRAIVKTEKMAADVALHVGAVIMEYDGIQRPLSETPHVQLGYTIIYQPHGFMTSGR